MANRLQNESSPYLLQHAHNPVDWYPWGPEALQKAKEENKVILISIGYSACHWCHVMERESFEDAGTAAIMNEQFVNIKVDREERPDLDQVYMDAVQAISGSGGWPLNVFLTPDARPFYGGTYFPPVRAYNRSSWREVLHAISSSWREKPDEILLQAGNLTQHLANASSFGIAEGNAEAVSEEQLASLTAQLLKAGDKTWGGFGNAPKFPQTMSIQVLLRQYYFLHKQSQLTDLPFVAEELLQQAMLSLDKMMYGGIYDQIGGGFARYSTDSQWLAPHFEKMLYDNALLIGVYAEAYQLTGEARYKAVIAQTMDFIAAEWQSAEGGFYSAYDADSEGVEGKFYTWQKSEIEQVLSDQTLSDLFCEYYNVTDHGNWEETNILWVKTPLKGFCAERNLNEEETRLKLGKAGTILLAYRNQRVHPLLDDKKLLGWNALMITACCKAWAALGDNKYLGMAKRAAAFIESSMKSGDGQYRHNEKNGTAANPAFLDDLAYYAEANIHLQEATGDFTFLEIAKRVTGQVLTHFADADSPFFYYTPDFQQDIIVRKKETYDGATPAGNSVMARNLLYLGTLLDNREWADHGRKLAGQMEKTVVRYPNSFGNWALVLQWLVYGVQELAIVGENARELSADFQAKYVPNRVLQWAETGTSAYPLLANRDGKNGKAQLFLCKQFACNQPVSSVADLMALL